MKRPEVLQESDRISKAEFNAHCEAGELESGPSVSTFGDNYGEPWNPNREAWGTLRGGKTVWAWVHGPNSREENAS